jgi:anti-sigma factor RsiW
MNDTPETTDKQWKALHSQLQDSLAGYADNSLDAQQNAIIEAHLAGCEACRADVVRQQSLSRRLQHVAAPRISAQLHQRLDDALAEAAPGSGRMQRFWQGWRGLMNPKRLQEVCSPAFAAVSGWGVAMMLAVVMLTPRLLPVTSSEVPMIEDVLAQYRHITRTALPVSGERSTVTLPATWPNAQLLASWETTVGGAPAQAYAVRRGDSVLLQFRIDEAVFFRNPEVRHAVERSGNYRFNAENTGVLAVPIKQAGLILVGPGDAMPSSGQLAFKST